MAAISNYTSSEWNLMHEFQCIYKTRCKRERKAKPDSIRTVGLTLKASRDELRHGQQIAVGCALSEASKNELFAFSDIDFTRDPILQQKMLRFFDCGWLLL